MYSSTAALPIRRSIRYSSVKKNIYTTLCSLYLVILALCIHLCLSFQRPRPRTQGYPFNPLKALIPRPCWKHEAPDMYFSSVCRCHSEGTEARSPAVFRPHQRKRKNVSFFYRVSPSLLLNVPVFLLSMRVLNVKCFKKVCSLSPPSGSLYLHTRKYSAAAQQNNSLKPAEVLVIC